MNKDEAFLKTEKFNKPLEAYFDYHLKQIGYSVLKGEYTYWYNTAQPNIEYLKEFIKRYQYRIFIREGNDINGYPLWCIYWGNEETPVNNFNVTESDKDKIYELKA